VKTPGLILPTTVQRPSSKMTPNEIGVFMPAEALFPGIEATEATMEELLRPLGRDAVLVACARLNTVVSGTGIPDIKARQERAIGMICSGEDLRRINTFAQTRPPGDLPIVFFRGQLLELMELKVDVRWERRPNLYTRRARSARPDITSIRPLRHRSRPGRTARPDRTCRR
jgi:hypothetical protein